MKYTIDGQPTDVIPMSPNTEGLQDIHRAIREAQHRETWARATKVSAKFVYNGDWCGRDELADGISSLPCPPFEKEKLK